MLKMPLIWAFCAGAVLAPLPLAAQEEESAEISLEENTDAFQENFYEALKQKGIENYDKAVQYLMECKKLDPANATVDFELGKCYLALKNYAAAGTHLLAAVKAACP